MLRKRVGIALSGGVDSSVAAYLLKEAGYDLHGVFMRTWNADDDANPLSECPWRRDLEDARAVAGQLGISFEVVSMIERYKEHVVGELVDGYGAGLTPNPDVLCNKWIKFGALFDHVKSCGCEMIATGHYCKKVENPDGSCDICEGDDKNKDQSYFLALLNQEQIKNALFPLGTYAKPQVRSIASGLDLRTAAKKDSQGICFLGKVKIQDFLAQYVEDFAGDIVTIGGRVLGRHSGLFRFTIGQRHGLNIPSNRDNRHYVVIAKDLECNKLIVEIESEDSPMLYKNEVGVRNLSFTNKPIGDGAKILAKPRYRDPSQKITFNYAHKSEIPGECTAFIHFQEKQRALAAGQIIAFYSGERLLGGGIYV
ncbi:MAG: tRNA 2-thiouridine(34) synthase MnmA [Puniceicoccales bacterium]|jgi:tRNA-specific 2-thiouridylase|nr:tRNA 2-thiouridine(34) synthase MnmA [Puniceicoccales bacterium]